MKEERHHLGEYLINHYTLCRAEELAKKLQHEQRTKIAQLIIENRNKDKWKNRNKDKWKIETRTKH
jgi:hypothetical protein